MTDRPLQSFLRQCEGTVALLFALCAPALLVSVGAAVDYGRALAAQSIMQSAVDSTAIGLVRQAANMTNTDLQTQAEQFFAAGIGRQDLANVGVTATYTGGQTSSILVRAWGSYPTTLMRVFGVDTIAISASSTVKIGSGPRLRVSLVLDNTGSMNQSGKLPALKSAAKSLLQSLQASVVVPEDAYVSIIPFNTDVNVGPSNLAASWIDWNDWNAQNGTCSRRGGTTQGSCSGTWTPANHATWSGCVLDRGTSFGPSSNNYDTNVDPPLTGTPATLFPADNPAACPQAVLALSNDWSGMSNLIDGMVAAGTTNQAIGLAHGWASLMGVGPFPTPPAYDPAYPYQHVIILLSDGLNTADRWYNVASSIDARQRLTCDNIKSAGIILYTVQVNTAGDPTSTILQYCASDAGKFYLLTSANQIIDAFQQIGADLQRLRIAQ